MIRDEACISDDIETLVREYLAKLYLLSAL